MAADDDEDLYNEEFDFVDDDDDADNGADDGGKASNVEEVAEKRAFDADDAPAAEEVVEKAAFDAGKADDAGDGNNGDNAGDEAVADDDAPPKPATDHVVHLYECRKFTRTIDRPFTAEDAEAFASDYNKTAKSYVRFAVTGKEDAKPKKSLE